MLRPSAVGLGLLLISIVGWGCAGNWVTPGPPNSPTDGFSVDVCMTGPAQKVVRYWFNGTGELWFAGGRDVTTGRITWRGQLDPAQGKALAAAIQEGNWFSSPPSGRGDESATWDITAWNAAGQRARFTVYGQAESVEKVYNILQQASSARFDDFLREMPKPSLDRQLDRQDATEEVPQ